MNYDQLVDWILNRMRPQEIYQPAAIVCLIYHGGTATLKQIHAHLEMRRQERDGPTFTPRTVGETRREPCAILIGNRVINEEPAESEPTYVLCCRFSARQLTALVALCEERIARWNYERSGNTVPEE